MYANERVPRKHPTDIRGDTDFRIKYWVKKEVKWLNNYKQENQALILQSPNYKDRKWRVVGGEGKSNK